MVAWLVSHRAGPAYAAMLAAGVLMGAWSPVLVPTFGLRDPLPLWALTPCLVALISATCVEHQVTGFAGDPPRLAAARLGWWATTVTWGAIAGSPAAVLTHQPLLAGCTAVLVALTFAAGTVLGRGSAAVGSGLAVWLVVHTPNFSGVGPDRLPDLVPGWLSTGALVVAALGGLGYALAGPRNAEPPAP